MAPCDILSKTSMGECCKKLLFLIYDFLFFSFAIGRTEVTSRVEEVPIDDTMLSEICPDTEAAFCFPQKYRTPNGECNNVKKPMWGVTGAAYLRLKEPEYEDGVGKISNKISIVTIFGQK